MWAKKLVCGTRLPTKSRPALPIGAGDSVLGQVETLGLGTGVTRRSLEGEFRTLQVSWPYTQGATDDLYDNGAYNDYYAHGLRAAHALGRQNGGIQHILVRVRKRPTDQRCDSCNTHPLGTESTKQAASNDVSFGKVGIVCLSIAMFWRIIGWLTFSALWVLLKGGARGATVMAHLGAIGLQLTTRQKLALLCALLALAGHAHGSAGAASKFSTRIKYFRRRTGQPRRR